jgi:pentalenolactone synthase
LAVEFGSIPFECPALLGEPEAFATLRKNAGLTRHATQAGAAGWLVTRHADLKALCADNRIGRSHRNPEEAALLWPSALFSPLPNFTAEFADHRRWRQAVTGSFSQQRISSIRANLQKSFDVIFQAMVTSGSPADIVTALAKPFAARSIFDIMGVADRDRLMLISLSDSIRNQDDPVAGKVASDTMFGYFQRELPKRAEMPLTEEVLSVLAHAHDRHGPLSLSQQVEGAGLLFLGGFETVAARIAHGLMFLLAHPAQWQRLCDDPSLVTPAVEEILRMAVPGGSWVPRYVHEDTEHAGAQLREGDLIVFAVQAANRDEMVFPNSGVFDITRTPNPHLAFGYGKFFCLGAGLARAQMQIVIETIVTALPGLKLAIALSALEVEYAKAAAGLTRLPVAWDAEP